jgi:MFS family permease
MLHYSTYSANCDVFDIYVSANFVAVGGALLAPWLCDGLGRRKTFSVSCVIFILGVSFVVLAPSLADNMDDIYGLMMAGRVLTVTLPATLYYVYVNCTSKLFDAHPQGFGIGVGLAIDPLYIAEVSPSVFRGKLVSMSEIAINVGILLGMAADYSFLTLPDGMNWKIMLGLGLVLPTALLVMTLTIMPESPRWLIAQGSRDEAVEILRKTNHPE